MQVTCRSHAADIFPQMESDGLDQFRRLQQTAVKVSASSSTMATTCYSKPIGWKTEALGLCCYSSQALEVVHINAI